MTTESGDIIACIKAAESEAAEMIRAAEEARTEAVRKAEEESARTIEETRSRLLQEYEAAVAVAKAEAGEIQRRSAAETEALAQAAATVPKDRLQRAVDLLVDALHRQWQ